MMAIRDDGQVIGSVSGGCIEDDLISQYTGKYKLAASGGEQALVGGAPRLVKYGITADEAHRFGLPCGGTLELLLEFDPKLQAMDDLLLELSQGRLVQRSVALIDGQVQLQVCDTPSELALSPTHLRNVFGPGYRMLIIGAGQMSEYLATMAQFNGFAVTVCDPREEYRGSWSVTGVHLSHDMPDDIMASFRPDSRSAIVALTHDPKLDDLALLEALKSQAFYIGAIGSRRNNLARKQRMVDHFEETESSLQRLRGPIGLFIGSKTPPEIAVSIMAEVLAVKNGVLLPRDLQVGPAKDGLAKDEHVDAAGVAALVCGVAPQH
jgi:xanthine dehydrogenase accessory factor